MKTEVLRSVRDGLKKIKKLWVFIIIIVLLIVHMGIFILKDFSFGYRYYEFNQQINQNITVGYSKEEMNIFSIMDEYLEQLETDGYYVDSCNINKNYYKIATIVPRHKINDDEMKQLFINSLDVGIFCKRVTINEDVYYFKNEVDKDKFVNEINSIKKIEYNCEEVIENKSVITKQDVLDEKINKMQEEKRQEEEQERIKQAEEKKGQQELENKKKQSYQVTSRGGVTSRTSSSVSTYKGGAPLASYSYISSYYGMRNGKMHTGTDFAAPAGTHIFAWKNGKVIQASWSGGYGNFIVIQHNDGTVSRYGHCSGYAVSVGQTVSKGQTIGYVGTTGNSTGNHLHFEIKINGNFVNPLSYL